MLTQAKQMISLSLDSVYPDMSSKGKESDELLYTVSVTRYGPQTGRG